MSDLLSLIWQDNTGLGRVFTLVLLALGIAAGGIAAFHIRRYRHVESGAVGKVRQHLGDIQKAHQPRESARGARPHTPINADIHALLKAAPAKTLIHDRLTELARMKQARIKVNVDALQQMTVMRENANPWLGFPGYAADLCTMLGMLGTFVGLCMMLLGMQDAVPVDGASALAAGELREASTRLGQIIDSKKTAFATTLVGLVCAIAVSALNFALVRAQSAFFDALERFTVAELLPATVPAVEDETAMEKLSLQLSESFAKLGDLTVDHGKNLEMLKGMEESFRTIVESIRKLTVQAAARGPEAEGVDPTAGLVRQMTDHTTSMREAIEKALGTRHDHGHGGHRPSRGAGWGALGRQLLGLATDAVEQLRSNPVLALGGVGGAVALVILLF